jgi:hypothetical protein
MQQILLRYSVGLAENISCEAKNIMLILAGIYSFSIGILARFCWQCGELSKFIISREYSSRAA